MKVEATGRLAGKERSVTWTNGRLSGDRTAILAIEAAAKAMNAQGGVDIPGGPSIGPPVLKRVLGFIRLAELELEGVTFAGDEVTFPDADIPEDAQI